jgi:vitamin B12 transporter
MRYFSIALLGVSLCASADQNPLEMITVTASRTPLQIQDAGSSVNIIDKEQIRRRNATNLGELLREIPGVSVNQQGSLGAVTQVRIRGAEANQLLVLIDGVEANDVAQGSEFNFTHLLTKQIERVEIIRGPQSSLWGSDALSGVIRVTTIPQALSETHFFGYLEGGSFNTVKSGFGVQHGSERSQTSFSVDYLDTDGSNISRSGNEDDGYKNITYNLSGKFDASDNLGLSYLIRRTDSTTQYDDVDFFTTGLPVDAEFETDSKQTYGGLSLNYDLENVSQTLAYSRTDTENINHTSSETDDETRGTKNRLQYQANLTRNKNIFSGVLEYTKEDYQQRGASSFFGDPNKNLDADTKSVAIEYRYSGDAVNLSLSARNDDNSEFGNSNPWRATSAWHLANESTHLFASIGEGVKNPTFTERFGFFDNFIGNPDLKPEESLSWEVGIRQSFRENKFLFTATWFNADLENEINGFVFDADSGSFTAANVEGKSARDGLELALNARVSERFTLNASYTYLDATQEDASGSDVTEVRRPKNSGAIVANYNRGNTNLNLQVIYTGQQEDDFFPPFPPYQERVDLDSYTLVNLSASYRLNDNLELTLQLENVFDENYEEVFGYSSPGRGAYGGVRLTW